MAHDAQGMKLCTRGDKPTCLMVSAASQRDILVLSSNDYKAILHSGYGQSNVHKRMSLAVCAVPVFWWWPAGVCMLHHEVTHDRDMGRPPYASSHAAWAHLPVENSHANCSYRQQM